MVVPWKIVVLIRGEREGETICSWRMMSRRLSADYHSLEQPKGIDGQVSLLMGRLADIDFKGKYLLPRKTLKNG